ncbi:hypothetical protein B9Z65_5062 [Elsinoe australis]|uniref:Uncharacterized protein n=1 Tax=Elsinoe australis TaxID=40998 RepID=A0A2P7ZD00_9PEZI|nr:hypothetical protein B9Z65_5062 [Elsinoe australis]
MQTWYGMFKGDNHGYHNIPPPNRNVSRTHEVEADQDEVKAWYLQEEREWLGDLGPESKNAGAAELAAVEKAKKEETIQRQKAEDEDPEVQKCQEELDQYSSDDERPAYDRPKGGLGGLGIDE